MTDPKIVMKYSNRILEIIDERDQYTRGDLQGVVEAVVIRIIEELKNQ